MNFVMICNFYQKKWKLERPTNFYVKNQYDIYIRNLKQSLKHRLVLKRAHRVIKFNENAWL